MIYLITGGERSGKSSYAMRLALELSPQPVYVATSRQWDDNYRKRIERHKAERGKEWTNIEEEKKISLPELQQKVAVIDCVTLWLTNFFTDNKGDVQKSLEEANLEFGRLNELEGTFIIISNEIGMGVHASTEAGRKFVELQGWMNQYIAARADKVILMVSGIPLTIK